MECFTEVLPGTKAAPHNYVCGSQRIFCTSSAVSKTGNTYSIPSFLKLCTGTKSLAELPCQIMRCCPKYKCVGGLSVFGSPPLKLRGGLFGAFAYCRNTMRMQNIMRHLNAAWMLWPDWSRNTVIRFWKNCSRTHPRQRSALRMIHKWSRQVWQRRKKCDLHIAYLL